MWADLHTQSLDSNEAIRRPVACRAPQLAMQKKKPLQQVEELHPLNAYLFPFPRTKGLREEYLGSLAADLVSPQSTTRKRE